MKRTILLALLLSIWAMMYSAWSTDPMAPNLIAGFTGEQVIPKVAITVSGNTYVCRFDNSSGGYRVFLNYLSHNGDALWTEPEGLLVSANPSMTWLTDYDMTVDNDGNAVIVFQDIRIAGVNNVFAYKISPTGEFLWGENGITMSSDTSTDYSNMSPTVFNSADNSTYVTWQRMASTSAVIVNRISPEGQKLWGENGITLAAMQGSYTWPQIIQSEQSDILLKYYHDSGPFWAPTRHIYVARYVPEGTRLWTATISNAGGLAAWQQMIPFEPDGSGGGILAWYEDRENDQDQDVYVQRVNAAGTVTMPANGALMSVDSTQQQYYPKLAVDTVSQYIYAFFRVTNGNQDQYGLARQMLDYVGVPQWGATAPMIFPISGTDVNCVGAFYGQYGAVCVYEYGSDQLYANAWRASGVSGWVNGPTQIAGNTITKLHFDLASHPGEWAVLGWEQGMSDQDIYAMRINANGTLGAEYPAPTGLTAAYVPPNSAMLSWDAPSQYMIPENYYVFLDGELAQVIPGDVTSYQIDNLGVGEHTFFLRARYAGDHYSADSNIASTTVVDADDALLIPAVASASVYPNPFRSNAELRVTLNKPVAKAMLRIYDIRGRKLLERAWQMQRGANVWDMSEAHEAMNRSGVYLIRLDLEGELRELRITRIN